MIKCFFSVVCIYTCILFGGLKLEQQENYSAKIPGLDGQFIIKNLLGAECWIAEGNGKHVSIIGNGIGSFNDTNIRVKFNKKKHEFKLGAPGVYFLKKKMNKHLNA